MAVAIIDEISISDLTDEDDWYCLLTNLFCSRHITGYTHCHETGEIIVWPERDDPNILRIAAKAKDYGCSAAILQYEKSIGPCVSFYELVA